MTEYIDPAMMWYEEGGYLVHDFTIWIENASPLKIEKDYFPETLARTFEERIWHDDDDDLWLCLYWAYKKTIKKIEKRMRLYRKLSKEGVDFTISLTFVKARLFQGVCKEFDRLEKAIEDYEPEDDNSLKKWVSTSVLGYWIDKDKEESK